MLFDILCSKCQYKLQTSWNYCPDCGKHIRPASDRTAEIQFELRMQQLREAHSEVHDQTEEQVVS